MSIFVFIFVALIFRYIYIMMSKSEELKSKAAFQWYRDFTIEESSYRLLDCYGRDLVDYRVEYYIAFDPIFFERYNFNKSEVAIKKLEYLLKNYNDEYTLDRVDDDLYNLLEYKIDDELYEKIMSIEDLNKIKGIYTYIRSKPVEKGYWSIESIMSRISLDKCENTDSLDYKIADAVKDNMSMKIRYHKDKTGAVMKKEYVDNDENKNVMLTIDKDIQNKIKDILASEYCESYKQVGVVLMEADTGKIRALVQKDDSKPNVNLGVASNHGFFAGSIFKVITEEAGLSAGIIDLNKFYVHNKKHADGTVEEQHIKISEGLARSCNDVFYEVGKEVGFEHIKDMAQRQGMFSKVLDLECEVGGNIEVNENRRIPLHEIQHTAIGQRTRITPLNAIAIPTTVINGGVYVKPTIVEKLTGKEDDYFQTEKHRVLENSTANTMREQMKGVVNGGSGVQSKIVGLDMGGKTGTTEYFEENKEGKVIEYSDGWFVSFFKANNRYYTIAIIVRDLDINDPYRNQGGCTAAPLFKKIAPEVFDFDISQ